MRLVLFIVELIAVFQNLQNNNTWHGIHVQLPPVYLAAPALQHIAKPASAAMQILWDNNKYYCIQGSNGVGTM